MGIPGPWILLARDTGRDETWIGVGIWVGGTELGWGQCRTVFPVLGPVPYDAGPSLQPSKEASLSPFYHICPKALSWSETEVVTYLGPMSPKLGLSTHVCTCT